MSSFLSRAFVAKQLISVLKSWAGRLIWRRRNIVLPTSNVSTATAATDSTATHSAKATTALAKKIPHPLHLGNADVEKVEYVPSITSAVISSASTSAHVDTDSTLCAELGGKTNGRFDAYAGDHAHNIQFHSHFIELKDCLSETNNCNQVKIHMKTLTKVAE